MRSSPRAVCPRAAAGRRQAPARAGRSAMSRRCASSALMIALLLRRLAADRRWRLRIAVTPDTARRHARHWRRGVEATGQGGGDLGTRMRRALAACPPGPVVLVGGDIPALAARHVAAAFRLLGDRDLVFGPAAGWRLLARRRPPSARVCRRSSSGCGGRALMRSPTRSPAFLGGFRSVLSIDSKTSTTARPIAGSCRAAGSDQPSRCSCSRGISSTKLHGRKRLSSWWTRMPSQASRQALGEPGRAKR